ncbi:Unknown protein [Striga hermonthica]|uniref:Retrotransposon Copia-like N-terminal domain-containing protein n=1 Tax=Striga hermonthica TaxID=68872 RepID=A0A9N7NWG7_STRHE|nr:Unknown protein [Striga hermonthica]
MASQTSSDSNNNTMTTNPSGIVHPQHQLISIKLTDANYLLWKQQTYSAIVGYGLKNFIAADSIPPPRFLSSGSGDPPTLDLEFATWVRQDQLLMLWLLSSLSENLLIMMVGKTTSREVSLFQNKITFSTSFLVLGVSITQLWLLLLQESSHTLSMKSMQCY